MQRPVLTSPVERPPLTFRQLRRSAKATLLAMLLLAVCGGLELAARCYWRLAKGVPFARTDLIWKAYYPEWDESGVAAVAPHHGDSSFDVLLLGGSALTDTFGHVGPELKAALEQTLEQPVRVVNLAALGRTTRDSRWKYERLADKRFDLVVVYHGINDAFLNNVPPGSFQPDYTHAARFEQLRLFKRHPEAGVVSFPFTLRYAVSRFKEQARLGDQPKREWHQHGADVRTPPSFRANLGRIAELARERGDRLVLMTYAYHIPANYSEAAFRERALDYGTHSSPVSLWGTPANVAQAIDLHNEAVRDLAARTPGAVFVDQKELMPVGKDYFNDCCHLTQLGSRRFVGHIMGRLDAGQSTRR
jgi:hypothetical protein